MPSALRSSTTAIFSSLLAVSVLALADRASAQFPGFNPEPQLSPQVAVDEIDNSIRGHFERAKQLLADQRWDDAVDVVSRLMEGDGDKLVALKPTDNRKPLFTRFVPLREFSHLWLVSLANDFPDALQAYRRRVDPLAERWLKEARTERSELSLLKIVDQFFASSVADDALLKLADAAMERGEYLAARRYLQQISPALRSPAAGLALWLPLRNVDWTKDADAVRQVLANRSSPRLLTLTFPDTDLAISNLLARLVLISILEGSAGRAQIELELLTRLYPDATGELAGRAGKWSELLQTFLEQSRTWEDAKTDAAWPTFAGNFVRNGSSKKTLDVGGGAAWSVALPEYSGEKDRLAEHRGRIGEDAAHLLSYHPIIVGQNVFVADSQQVRAFRAADGRPAWSEDGTIYRATEDDGLGRIPRTAGVPRFTLSASGTNLFVKVGSPITRAAEIEKPTNESQGFLLGLDLATQGRVIFRQTRADAGWNGDWSFEGSPVADASHLYVTLRHRETVRDQIHVACFDLHHGKLKWRRFVSAAESPYRSYPGISHNLLTLHDGILYCNTNLGAVAAIAARDGRIMWLTTYPRAAFQTGNPDKTDRYFQRDLNPCVIHQDQLFAAPADCDRIFSLDAATGQLIWSTDGDRANDVVHLLGVGSDRLIASGDYLYWFDVYSGQPVGQFPPPQKDGAGFARPTPRGYGRGLLAGTEIWWPTREKIIVFQQATRFAQGSWQIKAVKEIDLASQKIPSGNLVMVKDLLLIAAPGQLTAMSGE